MEALGDAVGSDLDAVGVFGLEGAVLKGGGEEVDYGEGETLARICGLSSMKICQWEFRLEDGWVERGTHTMLSLSPNK